MEKSRVSREVSEKAVRYPWVGSGRQLAFLIVVDRTLDQEPEALVSATGWDLGQDSDHPGASVPSSVK